MLYGRETEQTALAALIAEARAERGSALVVRGQPGVGKSALLEDLAANATGMQVLRAQGVESESPLAFAALQRFLLPVMRGVADLPQPQAQALRAAFGEIQGDGGDRFLVFTAALSLLSDLAQATPVLGLVDDAHWLDDASAAALLFVARRLQSDRIALVFGAREGDERRFDASDLSELRIEGLDREAVRNLLAAQAGRPVPLEVAERLKEQTGGNPLALVETPTALTQDQLTGRSALPRDLPLTRGIERIYVDRCRELPATAQTFLLVAAADDSGRLDVVLRGAAILGAGPADVETLEVAKLLTVQGQRVELQHPLVRSAVYGSATSATRQAAHRALAEALRDSSDLERRAWHLAGSVDGPDADAAGALDQVAERSRLRGGHEAASAAWERAAELSATAEARTHRLFGAALSAWLGGQGARANALARAAERDVVDERLRADITSLQARIEWNTGSVQVAHQMLLTAARQVVATDADRARELAMVATELSCFGGDSGVGLDPAQFAGDIVAASTPRARCLATLLVGLTHVAREEWSLATPALRAAFEMPEALSLGDQIVLPNLAIAGLHIGDDAAAQRFHGLLLTRARHSGAVISVWHALARNAMSQVATGKWTAAQAGSSEALGIALATGQPSLSAFPLAWLCVLAAMRGDDTFGALLAEATEASATHPTGVLDGLIADLRHWAIGIHTAGQADIALARLRHITSGLVRREAALDRIEAAVRADDHGTARKWIEDLDLFAEGTGTRWAVAVAAHGRAMAAAPAAKDDLFVGALELHDGSGRPFARARTELAYGKHLRRTRRRVDARVHLRAALGTFQDLGAAPWTERATQELRASGETAQRRDSPKVAGLTAQELQVSRFVAQGLSNREVAGQLFLSPRTIDFHLRNVFTKLGVSSRAELARLQLD
ncbi:MAG: AAA family ATPase [Actinomycetota bacterium]|nr:AAA family ATPase [Actinomycetota bacterium]